MFSGEPQLLHLLLLHHLPPPTRIPCRPLDSTVTLLPAGGGGGGQLCSKQVPPIPPFIAAFHVLKIAAARKSGCKKVSVIVSEAKAFRAPPVGGLQHGQTSIVLKNLDDTILAGNKGG